MHSRALIITLPPHRSSDTHPMGATSDVVSLSEDVGTMTASYATTPYIMG